jgi:hypothetical protein
MYAGYGTEVSGQAKHGMQKSPHQIRELEWPNVAPSNLFDLSKRLGQHGRGWAGSISVDASSAGIGDLRKLGKRVQDTRHLGGFGFEQGRINYGVSQTLEVYLKLSAAHAK